MFVLIQGKNKKKKKKVLQLPFLKKFVLFSIPKLVWS